MSQRSLNPGLSSWRRRLAFWTRPHFARCCQSLMLFLGQVFGLSSGSGNAASLITSAVPSHWMDANWWFGTGYTPMGKAFRDRRCGQLLDNSSNVTFLSRSSLSVLHPTGILHLLFKRGPESLLKESIEHRDLVGVVVHEKRTHKVVFIPKFLANCYPMFG